MTKHARYNTYSMDCAPYAHSLTHTQSDIDFVDDERQTQRVVVAVVSNLLNTVTTLRVAFDHKALDPTSLLR